MVGIIILNYNTWEETAKCVASIKKFTVDIDYHIYVVDNNSPITPSRDVLSRLNSDTRLSLIMSGKNKGYSAGNNIGMKKALDDKCDYILISNSDIEFVDNSIGEMRSFLQKNDRIGIVGPQIYNVHGDIQPFYMMSKLTAMGKIKNMLLHTPLRRFLSEFKDKFILDKELTEPKEVFGVSGCCFMMSRDCASYLFPFDERTFLYEEEYIIGVRMEESPLSVFIIPNTHVIHAHGASTKSMSSFAYKCMVESEQLYLKEYLKSNILTRSFFLILRQFLRFIR